MFFSVGVYNIIIIIIIMVHQKAAAQFVLEGLSYAQFRFFAVLIVMFYQNNASLSAAGGAEEWGVAALRFP